MMYPFMVLDDNTEIVHSELLLINNKEQVKVYFEKPVNGGFHSAECILPMYKWNNIDGFNQDEIDSLQELIESVAHLIIRFAKQGGLGNASNL